MNRIFKRLKELLDIPAPETGKVIGWGSDGNPANLSIGSDYYLDPLTTSEEFPYIAGSNGESRIIVGTNLQNGADETPCFIELPVMPSHYSNPIYENTVWNKFSKDYRLIVDGSLWNNTVIVSADWTKNRSRDLSLIYPTLASRYSYGSIWGYKIGKKDHWEFEYYPEINTEGNYIRTAWQPTSDMALLFTRTDDGQDGWGNQPELNSNGGLVRYTLSEDQLNKVNSIISQALESTGTPQFAAVKIEKLGSNESTVTSIHREGGLELFRWVISAYDEPYLQLRNGANINLLTIHRDGGLVVSNFLSSTQLGIGRSYDSAAFSRLMSTETYGSTYELQTQPEGQSWLPLLKWDRARSYLGIEANNLGLGTSLFGTSASRVLALASGTAPTSSPADAIQLWSGDVDGPGTAGLHIRTEDNTRHVFGPKVGIGTTTPDEKLEVNGNIKVLKDTYIQFGNIWSEAGSHLTFRNGPTTAFGISITGGINPNNYPSIYSNLGFQSSDGNVASPSYGFTGEQGLGMYRPTATTLGFLTGNTERVRITNTGDVGIGTAAPGRKLDVALGSGESARFGGWELEQGWIGVLKKDGFTVLSVNSGTSEPMFGGRIYVPGGATGGVHVGSGNALLNAQSVIGSSAYGAYIYGYDGIQLDNRSFYGAPTTFSFNGIEVARFTSSGNLGIGIIPQVKLDLNGTIRQTGSVMSTTTKSADYLCTANDYTIRVDTTATITPLGDFVGRIFVIKNIGTGVVTIAGTTDGMLNRTITTQYISLTIQYNGIDWDIL